jgi:predicted SAM-dependent methyltransferase
MSTSTRLERLGAALQKYPPAFSTARYGWQIAGLASRPGRIRKYLAGAREFRGLQIGSGPHHLDGWLATDLLPWDLQTVYMDATRALPFEDGTFDYVVAEHIIEHLGYRDARAMLGECHRVLKNNGVIRVSTPDLMLTHRLMSPPLAPVLQRYVEWSNREFGAGCDSDSATHVVNRLQHEWGHTFLYDHESLVKILRRSGFAEVAQQEPGKSEHGPLSGVDRHASEIGAEFNQLESLIIEATKVSNGAGGHE